MIDESSHSEQPTPLPALSTLRRRLARLEGRAEELHSEYGRCREELCSVQNFLSIAPKAEETLESLSSALFGEILDEIEEYLTLAVQEILGQQRVVKSHRDVKNGRLNVSFYIEQDDKPEDILTGQGGSVCNILSVGLRLIALSRLDPTENRPFLVLDEQDCWLKPELVPSFMGVVTAAAKRLGIQVLVISHHPVDHFANKAERVYVLKSDREKGAVVELMKGYDLSLKNDFEK